MNKDAREKTIYRTFILSTSLVIALVLFGIFFSVAIRTRQLLALDNVIQARVIFNTIVLARKWNAHYHGVYVDKKPGTVSNPYLVDPDVTTVDGRVLTLRTPALMTKEISAIAEKEGLYTFHITSLKLMNPDNRPDDFETRALQAFEANEAKEMFRTEEKNNRAHFRYMAPLYVESDCLQCHRHQGYAIGDVRGGISITFDIEDLQRTITENTLVIGLFGVVSTAALLGLIYYFMARLIGRLVEARRMIESLAITDELTGLFNRRHVMQRCREEFEKVKRLNSQLSCIIADIDHFKAINDNYGHLAGDEILKTIADRMRLMLRAYDVIGRYGGEEFLIVLPDTGREEAIILAERIRVHIKEHPVHGSLVTISLGVSSARAGDLTMDDLIKRADERLYEAKKAGRDRVL